MDRFGIGQVRLPEFHIDNFRLPVFGNSSGTSGNHEIGLHKSLVDAWYFSGYSNENPPASLVGAKGNALAFLNFAFSLNSGFGIYNFNFRLWGGSDLVNRTSSALKSTLGGEVLMGGRNMSGTAGEAFHVTYPELKIRVTGLTAQSSIRISNLLNDGSKIDVVPLLDVITQDGEYTIPAGEFTITPVEGATASANILYIRHYDNIEGNEITVEQIPSYDGYLCFDGVDDYIVWKTSPILEDYTVICKRKWFNTDLIPIKAIASKRKSGVKMDGAFIFERITNASVWALNYGFNTYIEISQQDVVYQTASSYNGHYALKRGTLTDTELLSLGSAGPGYEFAQCAIAYFALYSRTLTTQEIEKEKVKLEAEWNKRLIK